MSIANLCFRSVSARKVLSGEDIDGDAIFDGLWKSVLREIYLAGGSSKSTPRLRSNASVREVILEFEGQVQFLEGQAAHLTTPKPASKKRSFSEDDQEFVRDKSTSLQGDDRGISSVDEDSEFDFLLGILDGVQGSRTSRRQEGPLMPQRLTTSQYVGMLPILAR